MGRETGQKQAVATRQDKGTGVTRRLAFAFYTKEKTTSARNSHGAARPVAACGAWGHALSCCNTSFEIPPRFRPGRKVKRWPPSMDKARSRPGTRGRSDAQITVVSVGKFSQPFLRCCLWWLWGRKATCPPESRDPGSGTASLSAHRLHHAADQPVRPAAHPATHGHLSPGWGRCYVTPLAATSQAANEELWVCTLQI